MLGLGGLRKAVDLDEPLGGRRVVLVPLLVRRQLVTIEAVLNAIRSWCRALNQRPL